MDMGTKSGIGQGLAGLGQMALQAGMFQSQHDQQQQRFNQLTPYYDAVTNRMQQMAEMGDFGSGFGRLEQWRANRRSQANQPGSTANQLATLNAPNTKPVV